MNLRRLRSFLAVAEELNGVQDFALPLLFVYPSRASRAKVRFSRPTPIVLGLKSNARQTCCSPNQISKLLSGRREYLMFFRNREARSRETASGSTRADQRRPGVVVGEEIDRT
jgi:hypothetical protein